MSKCCSFFNTPKRGQTLQHTLPGETRRITPCDTQEETACNPCCTSQDVLSGVLMPASSGNTSCSEATSSCGAPDCASPLLAMMPVIYDECGVNLCRVLSPTTALPAATACLEVQVLDINLNLNNCTSGTSFATLSNRPNCVRLTLSNLDVTFRLTALDCCGNILCQSVETVTYLDPDECSAASDPDTNPTSVTLDIYVPYGLTYASSGCGVFTPTMTFLGPVAGVNNQLEQGLTLQAAAKVLRFDAASNQIALGLTLYIRSVYFTEYRIPHQGISIPPKAVPVEEDQTDACQDFVDGALLTPQICPAVTQC